MINPKMFFYGTRVKLFGGRLSQQQVDGTNAILAEWVKRQLTDLRWLAYMLATVYWETAHTMWPIEEYGRGAGHPYGEPDPVTGQAYYGRGFVQLTWKANYATMGRLLGIDLANHPEWALGVPAATQILFEGMTRGTSKVGDFTGLALDDCFSSTVENWDRARAIVNGTDHAAAISDIGRTFYGIIQDAEFSDIKVAA
jgi:putative chitinase